MVCTCPGAPHIEDRAPVCHSRFGSLGVTNSVSRHGSIPAAVAPSGQCEASTHGESATFAFLLGRKNLSVPAILEFRAGKPPVGIDGCALALGVLHKATDLVVLILLPHDVSLPPCETPCNTRLSGW